MTTGETIGIGLGFLAIVAPDFWPKMPKALSYTIAGIGFAWLVYSGILGLEENSGMKLTYGPLITICVGAAIVAGGIFWHISRIEHSSERPAAPEAAKAEPPAAPKPPPKLEDLFKTDFANLLSLDNKYSGTVQIPSQSFTADIEVTLKILYDFAGYSRFMAVYVPAFKDARMHKVIESFVEQLKAPIKEWLEQSKDIGIASGFPGNLTRSEDLVFSGRVFLYTVNDMDAIEMGHIVESFRKDGMFLEVRGTQYLHQIMQSQR